GSLAVRSGLGLKEVPGLFVGTKLLLFRGIELGGVPLLIRIDAALFFRTRLKYFQTSRAHPPQIGEIRDAFDVDGAPIAAWFARSEPNSIAEIVYAFPQTIDTTKSELFVH